ncbi:MAG: DNA-deoxyinosine glycosylase [Oscillospiraceae bacterium]|nr:DNA-deoxyinosine glycosylase [Oscillospiraceae bacterium]
MDKPQVFRGFAPIIGDNPRFLILGTFPSPISRDKGEYYAHPRNQFWRIIYGVFDIPFGGESYECKQSILTESGIALWDVIAECEAESALDSTIRHPVYNTDLPEFIAEHGIRRVFFNGNNAYTFYKRGIGNIEKNVLPSTSPAHAAMRFEEKLRRWKQNLREL